MLQYLFVLQEWTAPYLRFCPKQQSYPAFRPVMLLKTCGSHVSARTPCGWSGTRVCWSTAAAGTQQARAPPTSVASRAAAKDTISRTMFPKNSSASGTRRPRVLLWMFKKREDFFFFFASPANASPPMLTTATLDLGLYHVKWSCVRWGVPTSRHSRWSRNKFRFQMRPKAFKGDAAKSLIFH